MSVLTEATIRKLFRESTIVKNGTIELAADEKLTPAAKSFLSDHHVTVIPVQSRHRQASEERSAIQSGQITKFEDSPICSVLFRLTKLYPCFLSAQSQLHLAFQPEKVNRLGILLTVLERLVGHCLLEDMPLYSPDLPSHMDLQAIRNSRQLDQLGSLMGYQEPSWRLACYDLYIGVVLLRKEFEQMSQLDRDKFAHQLCQILKSMEVLIWLITSDQ